MVPRRGSTGHFSDSSRVRSYDRAARREHGDSVAYRRFPALKQFTDEELAAITMPYEHPTGMTPSSSMQFRDEPGFSGSRAGSRELSEVPPGAILFSAMGSFRSSVIKKGSQQHGGARSSSPGQWKRVSGSRPTPPPIPFRPCNPGDAREAITESVHGYVAMHTPYDAAQQAERADKTAAIAACRAGPFKPSSNSQAKAAIKVHYYLNSPDTETFEAERQYIRERAQKSMEGYNRDLRHKLLQLRKRETKQYAELWQ
mmetsp:Transcript_27820/g.70024  ORF Transcript_27820/g.70024 Transcript_27820/m.70024 type:complete len:257 (+) Transcript_27820:101-871(+)